MQSAVIQSVKRLDLLLDKRDFEGFAYSMYYADGMAESAVKWKIHIATLGLPEDCEKYPVRVLYFDVNHPRMSKNEDVLLARSVLIAKIKRAIRNRFKDRIEYSYDNVLHVSDNYKQSMLCDLALSVNKDVSGLFEELNKQYEYVIIKSEGRQAKDFPKTYYYYADVDILVHADEVNVVGDVVEKWLENKYGNGQKRGVTISRKDLEDESQIRVLMYGWVCFMIHLQTATHFEMTNEFNEECLLHREINHSKLSYVLPPKYDIFFRAFELAHAPHKEWHRDYIVVHKREYDACLLEKAFRGNHMQLQAINELFSSLNM